MNLVKHNGWGLLVASEKTVEIPIGHVSPQSNATEANPT